MRRSQSASIACCLVLAAACGEETKINATSRGLDGSADVRMESGRLRPPDALWPSDASRSRPAIQILRSYCTAAETAPLRRLTFNQYRRTIRDLTGVAVKTAFPYYETTELDQWLGVPSRDGRLTQAWHEAAEEVAKAVSSDLRALTGCSVLDGACARAFVVDFGLRAYRRPLSPVEVAAHFAVYDEVKALRDEAEGLLAVLRVMLQSPHFLYRPEIFGTVIDDKMLPSPHEAATRLAYTLWGSMPDAELLRAASSGELQSDLRLVDQVRRMLRDDRARRGMDDFIRRWLDVDDVIGAEKDAKLYPTWNDDLAAAMREEALRFAERVIFDGDALLQTLLTSTETAVNAPLAQLYGVANGGTDWHSVDLRDQHRMGLLTQGWFLASRSHAIFGSPAQRGVLISERFLCQPVPPPPNTPSDSSFPSPTEAFRPWYESRLRNSLCVKCHSLFDGLGFPFEVYDGIGAFRTSDHGVPIDTGGKVVDEDTWAETEVTDAPDLIRYLASRPEVSACVAVRWHQQALGRHVDLSQDCRAGELQRRFKGGGLNLLDLVANIAFDLASRPRLAGEVVRSVGPPATVTPTNPRTVQTIVLDLVEAQLNELRERLSLPLDRYQLEEHLRHVEDLKAK